ncbi:MULTISPECIES: tetratricopeptide repeat protein [unclassified Brevundimonas]|uniref:tetratricopeptide repeat protein n=1 Tax=unclassified Brevundimonas TaxID=2622653 RepID=UPI0025BEDDD3|nr:MULTISPECIES: tetratricopeptide repeat protein [unclassified Brevundimonas]
MSRTAAAAATMTLALWALSGAVQAQTSPVPTTAAAPARKPADAATRASYDRADALSRSVFWSNEQQINPMDPVAGVRMAQALREMGQFDQAAGTAQNVLTVQPANLEAMLEVGRAHIARGQAFYGIATLEQARAAAPRDWRPLSLLGVAYQQVRRPDDAKTAWTEALRLSPDNPDVLTNAAIARMGEGDAASAEILLRRAAAQPTATLKVRQNLALSLGLQGKTAEAEAILRRDLPPEAADANLRWLAERTAAASGAAPVAAAETAGPARTWSSVQGG